MHGHSELAYAEQQYGQCGDEPLALQMKVETVEKTLHIEGEYKKPKKFRYWSGRVSKCCHQARFLHFLTMTPNEPTSWSMTDGC